MLYEGNNILGEPLLFPMIEVKKISTKIYEVLSYKVSPKKCCFKNPNSFSKEKSQKNYVHILKRSEVDHEIGKNNLHFFLHNAKNTLTKIFHAFFS